MPCTDEAPTALARDAQTTAALIPQVCGDLQLLESILEHTHMLVAYLDTRFDFVRVNRAYAQADGRTPEEFIGSNHFELYPNEDNRAIFTQVLSSGVPYFSRAKPFEYAGHPERGVSYWDWSLVPTRGETGAVTGLVLTLVDVTLATETRESLRRERDLAEGLVRTARAIILQLDPSGNIVRFNPYFEELTGYRLDEVVGRSWFDVFIPQADKVRLGALFRTAIAGTETSGNVNAILTRSGGERLVQWFDTTLRDTHGAVSGLLAVGIDNTELISSQRDLELFKSIVRASSEAIVIADGDARITFVNAAYEKLSGLAAEDVVGETLLGRFVDRDSIPEAVRQAIPAGQCAGWEGEAHASDRHGRRFPIWVRIDRMGAAEGRAGHYILLAHDITVQKRQEQQRLEDERRRHETFVREIHHRIKNHLQGVIGLLRNSALGRQVPPADLDVLLGKISALAGVYDLGSKHAGDALPLQDVVASVLAAPTGHADAMLRFEDAGCPGGVWLCSEEAVPIALVLNELVTNACKHRAPPEQPIRVTLRGSPGRAWLRVENAGLLPVGFSLAERTGIGMGLSLVNSLLSRDCASLSVVQSAGRVIADLVLTPPLLVSR